MPDLRVDQPAAGEHARGVTAEPHQQHADHAVAGRVLDQRRRVEPVAHAGRGQRRERRVALGDRGAVERHAPGAQLGPLHRPVGVRPAVEPAAEPLGRHLVALHRARIHARAGYLESNENRVILVKRMILGGKFWKEGVKIIKECGCWEVSELGVILEIRRCVGVFAMTYVAAEDRYEQMPYRRTGRSGLLLPAISLGLWHNFGDDAARDASVRRAFDLGVTHFDLANNYGPPYGSAEINFGRILREDLAPYRDELIISTKAGYDMWPGPYGEWGSRKYLLASLDQSLRRMGLDYVDIFYSHRFDPETPLEETLGALDSAVRAGKALYVGVSSYSGARTAEAVRILRELGTPLLIHQPSYSLLNRWIEEDLLDVLGDEGVGCIVFSPLAQGMLTDKYLDGIPEGTRARRRVVAERGHDQREDAGARAGAQRSSRSGAGSRWRRWRSRGRCATRA